MKKELQIGSQKYKLGIAVTILGTALYTGMVSDSAEASQIKLNNDDGWNYQLLSGSEGDSFSRLFPPTTTDLPRVLEGQEGESGLLDVEQDYQ